MTKYLFRAVLLTSLCLAFCHSIYAQDQLQEAESDQPIEVDLLVAQTPANPGVAASPSNLKEFLSLALQSSPRLAVQRAKVNEAQMKALASGLMPNPEFEAGLKDVKGGDNGPMLGISQEVPWNGALGWERQSATLESSAEQSAYRREIQLTLADVERSYIHVLARRELCGVQEHRLEIAGRSLKLVSDTLKAGLVSTLPYHLAVAENSNAGAERILANQDYTLACQALAALLAKRVDHLPAVSGDLREPLLPANLDPSRKQRHDLQAADLKVQSAQAAVAAADRERIPNPVLGYSREEAGDDVENFYTIGFELPVLNTKKSTVAAREAERQTAMAERTALSRDVDAEIEHALTQMEGKRAALNVYENEIKPSVNKSLEAASQAFQSGATDLSLLLQTQSNLIDLERKTILAIEELRLAEIDYLLAIGAISIR